MEEKLTMVYMAVELRTLSASSFPKDNNALISEEGDMSRKHCPMSPCKWQVGGVRCTPTIHIYRTQRVTLPV